MKKPHALIGLLAALGTAIGVIVAIVGLPYGRLNYTAFAGLYHNGTAVLSVQVEVDCDTSTAGIQNVCNIPVPAGGSRTVAVIAENFSGSPVTIGSFNFDLFNPACGGAGATFHAANTIASSGCTISAGANGIYPNSSPNLSGSSVGFTNLVFVAGFQSSCPVNGAADIADSGTGNAMTSTSATSCNNAAGGEVLANGASVILATETYNVTEPSPTSIALTLSNVGVGNDNGSTLVLCVPATDPPDPPTGVTGPCFGATLNFIPPPPTNTPAPATATPVTPSATATNTATNTPIPPTATPTVAGATQSKACDPNETATNVGPGPSCNLFICQVGPCAGAGEGDLIVLENVQNVCTVDYNADPLNPNPSCLGDGVGAYEFQVEFDNFVIQSVNPMDVIFTNGGGFTDDFCGGTCNFNALGRGAPNCSMSITSENSVRFGCVTLGQNDGPNGSFTLAKLDLVPAADDVKDLFPGNDNGIPTLIKDNQCELADIFGHPVLGTVGGAGQLKQCGDIFVTVRILEGDLNLDCKVDLLDEAIIAQHYGAFFGSAFYQKWLDLEPRFHDLDIDIKDLQKVFGRDGSTCQNPIPAQTPVAPPAGLNLST